MALFEGYLSPHGRAASNQKCQRGYRKGIKESVRFIIQSLFEPCRPFRLCPNMYEVVRKLVFTDCRCASANDGSKSYEELFAKLDANKDGKVDVSELRAGLASMGIRTAKGAAQVESWKQSTDHKGYRKRFQSEILRVVLRVVLRPRMKAAVPQSTPRLK